MMPEGPQLSQEITIWKCSKSFFPPELRNNASVENCYFQQDGAPAHYARKVRDYLNQFFLDRWNRAQRSSGMGCSFT